MNEDYYDDEPEEEEKFQGFSILDERGIDVSHMKKTVQKIEEEAEETIATPIPENEQTVMIDNAAYPLPAPGTQLELNFDEGAVYYKEKLVGTFKPAFLKRLSETRAGFFAVCVMRSTEAPVMVKLLFSEKQSKGSEKIKPPEEQNV